MIANGNVRPVVMVTILAISACLSVSQSRAQKSTVDPELFVYGREQAVVDAIIKTNTNSRQADQSFRNDLDRAFSVLLKRAFPKPDAQDLARHTVDALCREIETPTHTKVSEAQRNTWVAAVMRTRGFESILNEVEATAIGHAKRERLINAGLTEMLSATGSKCGTILSANEAERITKMLEARGSSSKEAGIVGVNVTRWPAIQVLPGTPAAEAGLRDGDIVLRVNTKDIAKNERAADGMKALKETTDVPLSLTVKRGDKTLAFEVRGASVATRIKANVVAPGVVCIRIPLFEGSGIADKVKELVRKHISDTTSGLILDLRDNPGGRAEEANVVADLFLDEKHLQTFQFRNGRKIVFKSKPGDLDVRILVLTNRDTASAAEMLAMALRDNHRATVIGQPTAGFLFGKDGEKLSDGRMIVFRSEPTVLSPTGIDYSEAGLPPDIAVEESRIRGEDKVLDRAIHCLAAAQTTAGTGTAGTGIQYLFRKNRQRCRHGRRLAEPAEWPDSFGGGASEKRFLTPFRYGFAWVCW